MADKRQIRIELPELNRTATDHKLTKGACILKLETDKACRGGVESDGQVYWSDGHFESQILFQDYRAVYAKLPGIATQNRIDKLHALTFTPEKIEQIKAEVISFYQALHEKQRKDDGEAVASFPHKKIEAIASYGYGVFSFPGGFAIANSDEDEDGWFLSTHPIICDARPSLDEILDATIEMIQSSAVEGPLAAA